MSIEALLQAHTAAVEKNTAALLALPAAIAAALAGKAAANTDASTGTPQGNAGASTGVPAGNGNNAAGAAATGEVKRGPGRPSNAARAAAAGATTGAAGTSQQTGQTTQTTPPASTENPGSTDAGSASSDDDVDMAALLGETEPAKPKDYSVPDLQKLIKDLAMFGQAYVKRALAEMRKFKSHNNLEVTQLPMLQAKDLNAYGALIQVIWQEGKDAAANAKDPELKI